MKTNKHIRKRHAINSFKRPVAVVALLGSLSLAYAQGEALTATTKGNLGLAVDIEPAWTVANKAPAFRPITDDGYAGDAQRSVAQLIFALASDRHRTIAVEVYNEQGRVLQHAELMARPGRNALAMSVDRLPEGRYVALMHEGMNARFVRFKR